MSALATLPVVQFVIGLREGVEAALVVGIVATFLHQSGRGDALRWMWAGVALAVGVCVVIAAVLEVVDQNLPQRRQEGFEAIVGVVAVGMVTYMIVYMRRHAREMGGELRGGAARALALGSAGSLVAMAFLAVMREAWRRRCSCSRRSSPRSASARSVPASARSPGCSSRPRSAGGSTAVACGSTWRASSASRRRCW